MNQHKTFGNISDLEQTHTRNPWLSRTDMKTHVVDKLNHLLTYLTHLMQRWCLHNLSDHEALMRMNNGRWRRDESTRKAMNTSINDLMTHRHISLRVQSEVSHGRRR